MAKRAPILWSSVFCVLLSVPCAAQDLVPFIRLSPAEVTKAKQLVQSLKEAEERSTKAKVAWEQFQKSYQASHANLPGLKFTDDFRLAVAQVDSPTRGVFQTAAIELTAEERNKLENLRQEVTESGQAQKLAEIAWREFNCQLTADHAGNPAPGAAYSELTLSTGKRIRIYEPWNGLLAFTADYKLAFPLGTIPSTLQTK
jgi:hypothetical protein